MGKINSNLRKNLLNLNANNVNEWEEIIAIPK